MLSPPTWERILSHYPVKAAFVELRPKTCSLMLTLGGSRIELQGTGCCQENKRTTVLVWIPPTHWVSKIMKVKRSVLYRSVNSVPGCLFHALLPHHGQLVHTPCTSKITGKD